MIAQYLMADSNMLKQLSDADDDFRTGLLEQISEQPDAQLVDLGKLWDVIHFVLTGQSAIKPIPDSPFSEMIVGVETFSDDENADFIAYSLWDEIAKIVKALDQVNFAQRLEKTTMKMLRQEDIFPNGIWKDKKEKLDKEVLASFNELKEFYTKALDTRQNVVVSIL